MTQRSLTVDLIEGRRHASGSLTLTGELESDRVRLAHLIGELRDMRGQLADDPYLHYARDVRSSERRLSATLPAVGEATAAIRSMARHGDLVGIYAAGAMHSGFANSFGQRNWDTSENFNLDWSFFHDTDKAVKGTYAGTAWDLGELAQKAEASAEQMQVLRQTPRRVPPGRYRVFLTPAALWELLGVLGWGGFGLRAHRTKTTPLLKMVEAGARLHRGVSLRENTAEGVAPGFHDAGFIRPPEVQLIEAAPTASACVAALGARVRRRDQRRVGERIAVVDRHGRREPAARPRARRARHRHLRRQPLVSELLRPHGLPHDRHDALRHLLGRGRRHPVPARVMRFDETVYRLLGENLIALTAEREFILDPGSYFHRSTDSARLPGALVDDFTLTLAASPGGLRARSGRGAPRERATRRGALPARPRSEM